MSYLHFFSCCILTLLMSCPVCAQQNKTIQWQLDAVNTGRGDFTLRFKARLAPGWHLYSQNIGEGGPMPTCFRFIKNDDFVLIGSVKEQGHPLTFHDDMYGLDITWYSDEVVFQQKLKSFKAMTEVKGNIEYMTCNESVCVPGKHAFTLPLSTEKL